MTRHFRVEPGAPYSNISNVEFFRSSLRMLSCLATACARDDVAGMSTSWSPVMLKTLLTGSDGLETRKMP